MHYLPTLDSNNDTLNINDNISMAELLTNAINSKIKGTAPGFDSVTYSMFRDFPQSALKAILMYLIILGIMKLLYHLVGNILNL